MKFCCFFSSINKVVYHTFKILATKLTSNCQDWSVIVLHPSRNQRLVSSETIQPQFQIADNVISTSCLFYCWFYRRVKKDQKRKKGCNEKLMWGSLSCVCNMQIKMQPSNKYTISMYIACIGHFSMTQNAIQCF